METPRSEYVPISHWGTDKLIIKTDHLLFVPNSTTKLAAARGLRIDGEVIDTPRELCLQNLNRRWAAVYVDRIDRVVSIGESHYAPAETSEVVADDIVASLSIDTSEHIVGVSAPLSSHRTIRNRIGHRA